MSYRSMLFIPGNNPGMLLNSDILGADAVIIDLEDSVAISEKDAAKLLVQEYLKSFERTTDVFIRINPFDSPYFYKDLEAIKDLDIEGVVLPKASMESMEALDNFITTNNLDLKIIGLIETAIGLELSFEILSKSNKVVGVLLGAEDLTLDLGAKRTKESDEIRYARSKVIAISKALQIEAIDTPWTDTDDYKGLELDTINAKNLGMTGKALISPRHVDIVNRIFSPTKEELEYAIRVVEGLKLAKEKGLGVFSLDGKMIDLPIIKRAFNILKKGGIYKDEYNELLK